jgi:Flp pilus assembly protein TadG
LNRRTRKKPSKGMAVLVTSVAMVFIIPAVGLSIDAGMLYAVKAKLSAASDAASLAAARSLSVGLTIDDQRANAVATAERFFQANFPTGYMGTTNSSVSVVVDESVMKVRTVLSTASADAPSYFMKFLGFGATTVRAQGKASRRDVNVMLVLDRSGSMENAGACAPLKAAAKGFVNQFASGRDKIGLVTFGITYRLDFDLASDYKTRSGTNVITQLDNLVCAGGTNSATPFHLAYEQLTAITEPGALNVILFFTDGEPNTLTFTLPVRTAARGYTTSSAYPPNSTSRSPCTNTTDKIGSMYGSNPPFGAIRPLAPVIPVPSDTNFESAETYLADTSSGCYYAGSSTSNRSRISGDIAWMPDHALMPDGSLVNVTGYRTGLTTFNDPLHNARYSITMNNMVTAAYNVLDNVAAIARNDSRLIVVYSIGLGTVNAGNETLLKRVANDLESPIHTDATPTGLYVYAPDSSALNQAFYQIASEILRLAR